MVEQDAATDAGSGMDIDGEGFGGTALQMQRQVQPSAAPEPVAEAVRLQRVVSFEEQEGRQQVGAGGVAVAHGGKVGQRAGLDLGCIGQRLADDALERLDADGVIRKLACHPVSQGVGEVVVLQHGVADAVAHDTIMLDGGDGFLAHLLPDFVRELGLDPFPAQTGLS